MANLKRPTIQEVPFVIFGLSMVQRMTKTTTCDDVINTVSPGSTRLSVYVSVNGVERELAGRTRILKEWRAHGTNPGRHFVVKTRDGGSDRQPTKGNLKARLKAFSRRLSIPRERVVTTNTTGSITDNGFSKDTSTHRPEMTHRFSTIGTVTTDLPHTATHTSRRATVAVTTRNTVDPAPSEPRSTRSGLGDRLTTMKLGFMMAPAANTTGDTGGDKSTARRRTIFDADSDEYPRHSTPIRDVVKIRHVMQLPSTPTTRKLSRNGGKPNLNAGKRATIGGLKPREIMTSTPKHSSRDHGCEYDDSSTCSRLDEAFWEPSMHRDTTELCDVNVDGFDYSFDCTFPSMADCYGDEVFGCGSGGGRGELVLDDGSGSTSGDSTSGLRKCLQSFV